MNLGFRVGFMTTLGILSAYFLYQVVATVAGTLAIGPLLRYLLG